MLVHLFGTCEKRTDAQWRLPEKIVFSPQKKMEFDLRSGSLFATTQQLH